LQKFDIVTLFLGVYLGIKKMQGKKPSVSGSGFLYKKCAKTHLRASGTSKKKFRGLRPLDPQGREGNGKEGKGTEGCAPLRENPAYATVRGAVLVGLL
jgi:hypothetical protein